MNECWVYQGTMNPKGYGQVGRKGVIHRIMWEALYGPIPKGYDLHHTCETKLCFNPAHLKMLTRSEHIKLHKGRETSCKHGHPFSPENTKRVRGRRVCITCSRRRGREYKRRISWSGSSSTS